MFSKRRDHREVVAAVVQPITVQVVDLFLAPQSAAKHLGGHEPVLVDVSARVGHRMTRAAHEHVAVARYRATALPVRVFLAAVDSAHEG